LSQEIKNTINLIIEKTSQEKVLGTGPYTAFFRDCVLSAKDFGTSDIHIEPTENGVEIRLRIDGDLILWKKLNKERRESLIYEIKRLTNLSIAVSNKPLDSRVSYPDWQLNLRANSLPTIYGEKIVLRLLRTDKNFKLQHCGFNQDTIDIFLDSIREPNGVIIISGPTGSGKTSTLYSLLQELNSKERNIVTLEDPVEYTLKGLNQVEITKDLSFAEGLRSILRQDPDVILVGEIRDEETAKLAFKAASTGHLVLSTIHANGAAEVIERLKVLGIDEYMIRSNLRLSVAQRLAKLLCPHCSIKADKERLKFIEKKAKAKGVSIENMEILLFERNLTGCSACKPEGSLSNPGIVGRRPIAEFIDGEEIFLPENDLGYLRARKSLLQSYLELGCETQIDVTQVA